MNRYAVPLAPVLEDVPFTPVLGERSEQEVDIFSAHPVSIQDIRAACCHLQSSLQVTPEEADILEERTRGQSSSSLWHESCRLRLTVSCFHQIINMRQTTC